MHCGEIVMRGRMGEAFDALITLSVNQFRGSDPGFPERPLWSFFDAY